MPPISRRRALAGFGAVAAGALLGACGDDEQSSRAANTGVTTEEGAATTVQTRTDTSDLAALFDDAAACRVTPEQTEGPYHFDVDRIRTDIREDREGERLELALRVRDSSCEPIRDAVVEIWHCDASGVYSGFDDGEGETFLRGAQVTNQDGIARFVTVYPGWYEGRAVHIHAKVLIDRRTELTTQLYFEDAVTAQVLRGEAYEGRGEPGTTNATDGIFVPETLLTLRERSNGRLGLMTIDLA